MTDMTFYCRGCEEELPKEKKKREKKETTYNRLRRELIDTKCERDKWKEASKGWSKRLDEVLEDDSVKTCWYIINFLIVACVLLLATLLYFFIK